MLNLTKLEIGTIIALLTLVGTVVSAYVSLSRDVENKADIVIVTKLQEQINTKADVRVTSELKVRLNSLLGYKEY